jgi:hypothetical protein
MRDLSIYILTAIGLFLIWNGSRPKSTYTQEFVTAERVSPDITQVIIEKIQSASPDLSPLETLFINHQEDGTYKSRFMFLDTRHFYGTQLDVHARVNKDGTVNILKSSEVAAGDYAKAYKADMYQPYAEIQNSLDSQLKYATDKPITTPPLSAYKYTS